MCSVLSQCLLWSSGCVEGWLPSREWCQACGEEEERAEDGFVWPRLASGEDKWGDGSVRFSIKSRKTQLAPNITSDGFLDQLLPRHPTEEQIAFLAGHLDTLALIDMDPSMPSQARRQLIWATLSSQFRTTARMPDRALRQLLEVHDRRPSHCLQAIESWYFQ